MPTFLPINLPELSDLINADYEMLPPRRELPPGRTPPALPPGQTPPTLPPGPSEVPAAGGGGASLGLAGILARYLGAAAPMLALGGSEGQGVREFYEERDRAKALRPTHPPSMSAPQAAAGEDVVTEGVPEPQAYLDQFGTPTFRNRPGPFQMTSDPNAANKLRQFVSAKYGTPVRDRMYGGAAAYMNDLATALESRMGRAARVSAEHPEFNVDQLYKTLVEEPTTAVNAQIAGPLKELGAITEQERLQRQEASLGQIIGKLLGMDVGGVGPEGMKIIQGVLGEKRAQRTAQRQEEEFGFRKQQALGKRPSEASINGLAQQIINRQGLSARQTQRGWDVYPDPSSSNPTKDSAKRWAAAREAATEILMRRGAQ